MAFLNNAIVRHGELSLALRHTAVAIGGGHKATLVDIWADKDELAIATADIESRVPFRGEWTVRVSVSSEMLRRLVAKQPRRKPVLLTYAAEWLSVGTTRISAERIR